MGCDRDTRRQTLIRAVKGLGDDLGLLLVAERIEPRKEALWLARLGITRQQGYYFERAPPSRHWARISGPC